MTPEEKARQLIDEQLAASGWVVQTEDHINLSAARGVGVCELSFATGEPDYTLLVDGKALGTTEAEPEGATLTGVEEQSTKYVVGVPVDKRERATRKVRWEQLDEPLACNPDRNLPKSWRA